MSTTEVSKQIESACKEAIKIFKKRDEVLRKIANKRSKERDVIKLKIKALNEELDKHPVLPRSVEADEEKATLRGLSDKHDIKYSTLKAVLARRK